MTTQVYLGFDSFDFGTDGDAPYFLSRTPAPSSVDVVLSQTIGISVTDDDTGTDAATALVEINENGAGWQTKYNGSVFSAPYDGVGSGVTPLGNGHVFALDRSSDFSKGDVIQIRFTIDDIAGNTLGPVTWQFSALADPYFTLRDPAPLDTGIALDADVTIRVRDDGSGIDEDTFDAYVDFGHGSGLEKVYDGLTGWQGAFNGTYTEIAVGLEYEVKLTTHPGFAEGAIQFRAYVEDNAGGVLDETWGATTVLVAPTIHAIEPEVSGYIGSDRFILVEFRDTGGSGVNRDSIDYDFTPDGGDPIPAVVAGVVQPEFIGMLTENVANSGWDLKIKPRIVFEVGDELTADASCEDF